MYQDVRFDPATVTAAMRGNQAALDGLVASCLPLVYNIVGRSMDGHADVDDVVQETMLHAVRGLPGLRDPERFRPWLVAIAIQQVRGRWRTGNRLASPTELDPDLADPAADFVDLTIAKLGLQGQRLEVAEATRWLDEGDRNLLSLWWLEAAGELTRSELADALELTSQQVADRVRRMREQLDAARVIVRALRASPRCAQLASLARDWNGLPSPLWRKRFARHTRECDRCAYRWSDLVPADRLLVGLALVPLPVGLALPELRASVGGRAHAGSGNSGGWFAKAGSVLSAKPAIAAAAAVVVLGIGVVAANGWGAFDEPSPKEPTAAAGTESMQPAVTASMSTSPSPSDASPKPSVSRFGLLPPGAKLPSGAQCATAVRAKPIRENKAVNATANRTTGHTVPGATAPLTRVDGKFTGTTEQILRWAACKWGIDEDMVKAQAAIESWWHMDNKGDYGTDASRCPAGHGLGEDGAPGKCPESYGIMQVRYPYNMQAFPGVEKSTAMNADYAYAVWRSCYEGKMTWLNTVDRGSQYKAGDAWGCLGVWFAGRWHTDAAEQYVKRVKEYLSQRIWTTRNFQQP
ncbi:sigma-70 family RNA polymerase sigma factor [Hamadaea sp.]|uniref:sigma-70 family RNA polymerase sigma factor n=1 Tax=Hamadaea sp. TaxID=2024425 RepID=UPI0025B7AB71|nr:sigma-70 family RNA polymerase sigma factor [Hamadaea sp.]